MMTHWLASWSLILMNETNPVLCSGKHVNTSDSVMNTYHYRIFIIWEKMSLKISVTLIGLKNLYPKHTIALQMEINFVNFELH